VERVEKELVHLKEQIGQQSDEELREFVKHQSLVNEYEDKINKINVMSDDKVRRVKEELANIYEDNRSLNLRLLNLTSELNQQTSLNSDLHSRLDHHQLKIQHKHDIIESKDEKII